VSGALYRTGPGACKVENTPKGDFYVNHWFDGFAHSHKFDIVAGDDKELRTRVFYSSRRQSEQMMTDIKATGYRRLYSFGQKQDPCVGIFGKFMSVFEKPTRPSEENICVVVHNNVPGLPSKTRPQSSIASGHRTEVNNVWVTTDNSSFLELDISSLEPIGFAKQTQFHPDLKGPLSCAHSQRDPENGDLFNFNLEFGRFATYRIFRVDSATGKTEILATICEPSFKAAYIHSFFLTKNYVVLCVPGSHYGYNGIKLAWEKNILDSIDSFDSSKTCKWAVVDRRKRLGVVARFETPAGFFFHSVNAWEEPDEDGKSVTVIFDVVQYANLDIIHSFYYNVILDRSGEAGRYWESGERLRDCHPKLVRYRIRFPVGTTHKSPRDDGALSSTSELQLTIGAPHVGELPTINPAYACKNHRYVYSLANRGLSTLFDALVKTDMETQQALFWTGPMGHSPGEAIFVARPPADDETLAEDDGVLLTVVLDGHNRKSYLLCLDAKTMKEVGRADCDFAVGIGFHGIHAKAT
jgi:torulene dioxygenase